MKKIFSIAFVTVSLSACHYGVGEAQKTLDANEQYKNEKAEYSTNRGNDGVKAEEVVAADSTAAVVADTVVAPHTK
jgi:hypothetical protein